MCHPVTLSSKAVASGGHHPATGTWTDRHLATTTIPVAQPQALGQTC